MALRRDMKKLRPVIACLEEIAYRSGLVSNHELRERGRALEKTDYGGARASTFSSKLGSFCQNGRRRWERLNRAEANIVS